MFSKKASSQPLPPPAHQTQPVRQVDKAPGANPYLDARREWDERYGDIISRAGHWRAAAFGALAVALVAVSGVAYIGSQSKIQPFIIAVDDLGSPVAVARPDLLQRAGALDQRILKAQIGNFVHNSRAFLGDFAAQQVLLDRTFAMLSSEIAPALTDFYRNERMPLKASGETVTVDIRTVLHVGGETWQVDWTETKRRAGQAATTQRWRAILTVGVNADLAQRPDSAMWNPFGVYIRALSWQKEVQ